MEMTVEMLEQFMVPVPALLLPARGMEAFQEQSKRVEAGAALRVAKRPWELEPELCFLLQQTS